MLIKKDLWLSKNLSHYWSYVKTQFEQINGTSLVRKNLFQTIYSFRYL